MLLPPQPAITDLSTLYWTPPTPSIFFHVKIGKLGLKILDVAISPGTTQSTYQMSVRALPLYTYGLIIHA